MCHTEVTRLNSRVCRDRFCLPLPSTQVRFGAFSPHMLSVCRSTCLGVKPMVTVVSLLRAGDLQVRTLLLVNVNLGQTVLDACGSTGDAISVFLGNGRR